MGSLVAIDHEDSSISVDRQTGSQASPNPYATPRLVDCLGSPKLSLPKAS